MPVLHADKTSIRVNRKKLWINSCSFADLAVKKCPPNLGANAVDTINIIPHMGALGSRDDDDAKKLVLVHDRWATFFKYDKVDHALCNAHPLKNLKHIEKAHCHKWAQNMRRLLLDACREVTDADAKMLSGARFEEVRVRCHAIVVLAFGFVSTDAFFTTRHASRESWHPFGQREIRTSLRNSYTQILDS